MIYSRRATWPIKFSKPGLLATRPVYTGANLIKNGLNNDQQAMDILKTLSTFLGKCAQQ